MQNITDLDRLAITTAAAIVAKRHSVVTFGARGSRDFPAGKYVIKRRDAVPGQDPWIVESADGAVRFSGAPTLDCAVRISIRHLGARVETFSTR